MNFNCRICGSNNLKIKLEINRHPITIWPCFKKEKNFYKKLKVFKCLNCGFNQLQKMTNSEVFRLYKYPSFVNYEREVISNRVKNINRFLKKENICQKKALDVGGGKNNLYNFFNFKEKWICDIEIDKKLKYKNIKIIKNDFIQSNLPVNFFNIIFLFHTMEHVNNPLQFMKKIFKITSDNAMIFIEVPNNNYYTKNIPHYAFFFQHINLFTKISLINLMKASGFTKVNLSKYDKNNQVLFYCFKKNNLQNNNILPMKFDNLDVSKITNFIRKKTYKTKSIISKFTNKKIGFYGAGGLSILYFSYLEKYKKDINFFYDSNKEKVNKFIPLSNIKVRSSSKLNADKPDLIILTSKSIKLKIDKKIKVHYV